ncbi:MAG: ribosomal-processing cysteine protease Prp [Clostridiales bacterium]|nr:ribosomal-processing cysteine protease Prp [Clostridiales bacterium]
MIKVTIFKNADNLITGFKMLGHANYAEKGSDIVCAAVSALVINTINSIDHFTSDTFDIKQDEDEGFIEFHMVGSVSSHGNLLLNSLALGLEGISEEYSDKYIRIFQKK